MKTIVNGIERDLPPQRPDKPPKPRKSPDDGNIVAIAFGFLIAVSGVTAIGMGSWLGVALALLGGGILVYNFARFATYE